MKTIIQELIQIPAWILRGSGQLKLDIGRAPGREAFLALYRSLAPMGKGVGQVFRWN